MQFSVEVFLERFASIARPEILRDHLSNSCVASTWITIQVVRQLGFAARPLEVRLSVGNNAYRRLRDQFGPPRTRVQLEQWAYEHGVCIVGVGFDVASAGIGGHLVTIVQERFLVDASIDQVANPTYGLNPPPVLWWPVDPLFLEGLIPQRMDVRGLFIEYSRHAVARRYEASQDWRHNPQTDSAVLRILSTINNTRQL